MTPLLQVQSVTKRFGNVTANDQLDLEVQRGEVHAVLGENGAGKSTLMNMLYGLFSPDEGRIVWQGEPIEIHSPRHAISLGIGMVHQHFMLVNSLSVLENIVLGLHGGLRADMAEAERRLRAMAEEFNQPIDPHALVSQLSVGERQRVEILKALYRNAELLILDEPTASLTPQEADYLFDVCRKLVARGKAVIFISHKLDEIMALSDRVTVLRHGKAMTTVATQTTTPAELARLMVGRTVAQVVDKKPVADDHLVLKVTELSTCAVDRGVALEQVSLSIRAGEILGIAGVDGNGQVELVEAILGLRPIERGEIWLQERRVTGHSLARLMREGVALVPADRHAAAIVEDFSLIDNAVLGLSDEPAMSEFGLLSPRLAKRFTQQLMSSFGVKAPSPHARIGSLSGGNQQKLVMARALSTSPRLFVVMQPTRGLDIEASAFVRGKIVELRNAGGAVLLVSMDLDEVLNLSDRVAVMHAGHIMATVGSDTDRSEIGLLMAGSSNRVQ